MCAGARCNGIVSFEILFGSTESIPAILWKALSIVRLEFVERTNMQSSTFLPLSKIDEYRRRRN